MSQLGQATIQTSQILGTTTNDSAAAGYIGESSLITRLSSSLLSLTTATTANVGTTTSITLTPGDWQISGAVGFFTGTGTSISTFYAAVSKTSATLPAGSSLGVPVAAELWIVQQQPAVVYANGSTRTLLIPAYRASVAVSTPIYLVAQGVFTVSTLQAFGYLEARRMR